MIRRLFRLSFRFGVLVAIAAVVKKVVDNRSAPAPAASGDGAATTWPPLRIADEPAPAQDPEPAPAPAPTEPPLAEAKAAPPADEPEPKPAPEKKPAATKRVEPLRAARAAERSERPLRANRAKPAPAAGGDGVPNAAVRSWVEPVGDLCPTTHPVKAKLGSKVFRVPGMPGYDTSRPDRCYASEGAARRAGFTEARR